VGVLVRGAVCSGAAASDFTGSLVAGSAGAGARSDGSGSAFAGELALLGTLGASGLATASTSTVLPVQASLASSGIGAG